MAFGLVFTASEAAAYLRLQEEEVISLAESRQVRAQKIGREWRFVSDDLDRYEAWQRRQASDSDTEVQVKKRPPYLVEDGMISSYWSAKLA